MPVVFPAAGRTLLLLVALVVWLAAPAPAPAAADELADYRAAVAEATLQYRVAMTTLETSTQERTAAAVSRFREAWQAVIDRHAAGRTAGVTEVQSYGDLFFQTDVQIISALLVIDLGSRDAARAALTPIAQTLLKLSAEAPRPLP